MYTSRGYGCGFYSHLVLVESNADIGQKQTIENRNGGRAKYKRKEQE